MAKPIGMASTSYSDLTISFVVSLYAGFDPDGGLDPFFEGCAVLSEVRRVDDNAGYSYHEFAFLRFGAIDCCHGEQADRNDYYPW